MVGQMTLVYIILRHNQEQARCYQINANLLHCALTERKPRGGGGSQSTSPSFCITVGCWSTSYSYNLTVEMKSHDSRVLQH